ncbi:hypothetical protein [Nocardioides sp. zg-1228]|uniref:hypothetical protein n=1 Tax=Nocardioides sp. zg-1228 TaxID=2763008 RepID=UPI001643196A|nr:hypothetical protein [Nocardioides sp. zg-1228]MBC2931961.1 hypothetical protein [Nocardioides sp. zg-1228]QSF57516.1 hypothetical protein JX575_18620 [Nocardioides sp. zg-1228]
MRISRTPTTSTVVAALLLGLLATLTVAVGAATGAGRTSAVKACASKSDGSLRLVGTKKSCRRGEQAVTWNKRGVPGSDGVDGTNGAAGAAGAAGERGPAGAPGVSGYQIVERSTPVDGFFLGSAEVACPAGKRVVGGGVSALNAAGRDVGTSTFLVRAEYPSADGSKWGAIVENGSGTVVSRFVIRAICVTALD